MAHDTTPERSDLVAFFTVLTVFFLVTVSGGVWALYKVRAAGERQAKRDTSAVERARQFLDGQRQALRHAPLPIERAMERVAQKGHAASPALTPHQDPFDDGPLKGWFATREPVTMGGVAVVLGRAEPPPAAPSATPDASVDGGVAPTEAGAPSSASAQEEGP